VAAGGPEGAASAPPTAPELGDDRFRVLVDSVRDYAIFRLDAGGHITSWNAGAERIYGYRAEEILGKHLSTFYPPDDLAAGKPALEIATASTEGRYEEEGVRVRQDGERFHASVVLTALRDGEGRLLGFAKVTRDVTDRHAALEALRQSEERFRLMVEAMRDYAIFMLDPDGRVASWNAGAERIKGYRADEIVGQHFSAFYTDADRARRHPEDELARAIDEGSCSDEGWRVRKDGSCFWASVLITAVRDPAGRLLGFAKVTRDLTERRRADEALRQANADLEARVRQQQAAHREVEAFSYSVSHDLRAPLRALDGFSKLLLERVEGRLDETEKDFLARIRAAAQNMAQLIDAMLDLSRLTRAPLTRRLVDVSALSREIAAAIVQAEPERRVRWEVEDGITADADPRLLRVALENLLRNAWKFTRNRAEARIEVGVRERDGKRAFLVRDNGAGFDPGQAHRLFLPFQRLHRARDFEGTGIGLATVHRIVTQHGGEVWAEAAPDAGATFFFTMGEAGAA
jgi:PAS domain S-box-containing protein